MSNPFHCFENMVGIMYFKLMKYSIAISKPLCYGTQVNSKLSYSLVELTLYAPLLVALFKWSVLNLSGKNIILIIS
jgi:hypothetical protein